MVITLMFQTEETSELTEVTRLVTAVQEIPETIIMAGVAMEGATSPQNREDTMEQKTVLLEIMTQTDTTKTQETTITIEISEVQGTQAQAEDTTVVLAPPTQEVASTTQDIQNQTEAITDQAYQTLAEEDLTIPAQAGEDSTMAQEGDSAVVQEEVAVEEVYHGEEDKKYTQKERDSMPTLSLVIYLSGKTKLDAFRNLSSFCSSSGKRDSNSRPQPWQGCALPTELFPQESDLIRYPSIFQYLIYFFAIPLNCECKITTFWPNCQIIHHFFNPFYCDNH